MPHFDMRQEFPLHCPQSALRLFLIPRTAQGAATLRKKRFSRPCALILAAPARGTYTLINLIRASAAND